MNPIECIQCPNIINMNADIESNQLNVLYNVVICSYKNFLNQPSNTYMFIFNVYFKPTQLKLLIRSPNRI